MIVIGYIIQYEGERDPGAFVSGLTGRWSDTVRAMMHACPTVSVIITPVDKIPEWVER